MLLAVLVTGSIVPAASPSPAPAGDWVLGQAESALESGARLAASPDTATLLERLARQGGAAFAAPALALPPASPDLASALGRLALATGQPVPATTALARLDPQAASAAARIVDAASAAADGVAKALSALTPQERAELLAWQGGELPAGAEKADLGMLVASARLVAQALDGARAALAGHEARPASTCLPPTGICTPVTPSACAGLPQPLVYLPPLLLVGGTGDEGFDADAIVSLDLGGHDAYCNNAASTYPGAGAAASCATQFSPVAALLDLAGNDAYRSAWSPSGAPGGVGTDPSVALIECYEGAAGSGIAILLDAAGNDRYSSHKNLVVRAHPACGVPTAPYPAVPGDVALRSGIHQGSAVAGVGLLVDLEGDDEYLSSNGLCHVGSSSRAILQSRDVQGSAQQGIGAILDRGAGSDRYLSGNRLESHFRLPVPGGAYDSLETVNGQGFGGTLGVGALLDEGGDDRYLSDNRLVSTDPGAPPEEFFKALYVQATSFGHVSVPPALDEAANIGGIGILHDGGGSDGLLSANQMGTDPPALLLGSNVFEVFPVQAVNEGRSANLTLAGAGDDKLLSSNELWGEWSQVLVLGAQAQSRRHGSATLVAEGGSTSYLSHNRLAGSEGQLTAQGVQAYASGGTAVLLDRSPRGAVDHYLSDNRADLAFPVLGMQVQGAQGTVSRTADPTAAAAFRDLDPAGSGMFQDLYNSGNAWWDTTLAMPTASVTVRGAQGAVGIEPTGSTTQASASFVDEGAGGLYNTQNVQAGYACPWPTPMGECVDWVQGVAATGTASFVDRSLSFPPDAYVDFSSIGAMGMPAGGWADGMLGTNSGPGASCEDLADGPDLPPGHACLDT